MITIPFTDSSVHEITWSSLSQYPLLQICPLLEHEQYSLLENFKIEDMLKLLWCGLEPWINLIYQKPFPGDPKMLVQNHSSNLMFCPYCFVLVFLWRSCPEMTFCPEQLMLIRRNDVQRLWWMMSNSVEVNHLLSFLYMQTHWDTHVIIYKQIECRKHLDLSYVRLHFGLKNDSTSSNALGLFCIFINSSWWRIKSAMSVKMMESNADFIRNYTSLGLALYHSFSCAYICYIGLRWISIFLYL